MWSHVLAFFNEGTVAILMKGGLVMIPLLAASLFSLTVIIERFCFWRYLRKQEVDATVLSLVAEGYLENAIQAASRSRHPVARVLQAGLMHKGHAASTAMEAAAQAELRRLRRYLPVLDTIITLAPLLGLLGTITGMISAFGIVSETGLGQPHAITGGIAEALIATATGLFIAIMTLVPYNYFVAKAEQCTNRMEEQATRLELLLFQKED
jgi:biopolymer transport protein ExbB